MHLFVRFMILLLYWGIFLMNFLSIALANDGVEKHQMQHYFLYGVHKCSKGAIPSLILMMGGNLTKGSHTHWSINACYYTNALIYPQYARFTRFRNQIFAHNRCLVDSLHGFAIVRHSHCERSNSSRYCALRSFVSVHPSDAVCCSTCHEHQ